MTYVPHTPEDREAMLRAIGLRSLDELFRGIPEALRLRRPLRIPARRSEAEILTEFERLARRNVRLDERPSFLGAGSYRRYVPAAIDYLASRGEFNTSYTPYQPEVSQGTLQAIFEYQSLICRLTGMEIANASLYEAGTALAEAVLMAYAIAGPEDGAGASAPGGSAHVLVSEGVHPEYRQVLETYLRQHPLSIVTLPLTGDLTPPSMVASAINEQTVAVVLQSPNFLGAIEDAGAIGELLRARDKSRRPFFIAVVDPTSLALLEPPGSHGADIAVGDGQPLGNYPAYGGPTFGFFTTLREHVRRVPGRLVGETKDRDGKRGYVLTFQTREQHIRRERATSNICTNQGLLSLRGAMYLSLLGDAGLREVAETSTRMAHLCLERLLEVPGVRRASAAPFFGEFPLELPRHAEEVYDELDRLGITGGLPLGRYFPERQRQMLFACTELTAATDIEQLTAALRRVLSGSRVEEDHAEHRPSFTNSL
jgi:glycine dehydrogenase subunit 1